MRIVTLFIGTRRGLFIARSRDRQSWTISEPLLPGREVYHAFQDPRDPAVVWAATDHAVWGAHVHRSSDGGATWEVLENAPHHTDQRGLEAVWALAPGPAAEPATLLAGVEPAGLFRSRDRGKSWEPLAGLNDHPSNTTWQPAGGGLALHSIIVDPRNDRRMWCAISAGGVYRSDDGGATWTPRNRGVRAAFQPNDLPDSGQCVHKLLLHPLRPDRLYQQNHCGTYRSDDGGNSWMEITAGLPSDFGYALAIDPHDPDTVFVIPEESSHMRTVAGGMLRVFRSRDAGVHWEALTHGLPQAHAYVSILREAMCSDTLDPCGVFFGTSSGHLFASADCGETWQLVAGFMPRVLSITAGVTEE